MEEKGKLAPSRRGIIWVQVMRGEPIHSIIKMAIGAQDGRQRERIELEQQAADVDLLLLIPDLTAESVILPSVKWVKNDCANWVLPQISMSSGAPRFTFIPPENGSV